MNVITRKLKSLLFKPLSYAYKKYSQKERTTCVVGISLKVLPGVFNPRLFFSTKFLMNHLDRYDLTGKQVLDVGSGSGALAIMAALKGAEVVAIDINPLAIENTVQNAQLSMVIINVIQSDLWTDLPIQLFDFILVNPPYYPKEPESIEMKAWHCGNEFQYFQQFFVGLTSFINVQSNVLMVLSEDCNFKRISEIATAYGFKMNLIETKKVLWEVNYIFRFVPS